jgi:hypothetical protein
MRRVGSFALVLGIAFAVLLATSPSPGTRAQEADGTPAPSGVTFEPVAESVAPELVTAQAEVRLERARFEPGATYTVPTDDTSLLMVAVESGDLAVRSATPLVINRAADNSATGEATREQIAAEREVTLQTGDAFVRQPGSEQHLRNNGELPAVALMASISSGMGAGEAGDTAGAGRDGGLVVALSVVVVPHCPEGYIPAEVEPMATPGGGGGGGGAGGVAVAIAAAPECVGGSADTMATPTP